MGDELTLDDLSQALGGIPLSTLKHRLRMLGLKPTSRGTRNKLFYASDVLPTLEETDRLLRGGMGIAVIRTRLGLTSPITLEATPPPSGHAQEKPTVGHQAALEAFTDAIAPLPAHPTPIPPPNEGGHPDEPEPPNASLQRLSRGLESALEQLAAKDRQVNQLQDELRAAREMAATFQQKTFYLQGELQRLQGELREARGNPSGANDSGGLRPWRRLFNRDER